jgi:hypothetical protein
MPSRGSCVKVGSIEAVVRLLGKSFVRCISLGASSYDVGAADPSQEVMSEGIVRW